MISETRLARAVQGGLMHQYPEYAKCKHTDINLDPIPYIHYIEEFIEGYLGVSLSARSFATALVYYGFL